MVLKNIRIRNFRAYKDFGCEFVEGVNLVIGDNGAGKTSLLAAVAQLLSVQLSSLGGSLQLEPTDPHLEVERAGDVTVSSKECYPIKLSGKVLYGEEYEFGVTNNENGSRFFEGDSDIIKRITEKRGTQWPLINYQRFDRNWKIGKNKRNTVEVDTGYNERKDGYKQCLSDTGHEETIQKWCLKMAMLEYERKDAVKEFERYKRIVKDFLQAMEEDTEDFEVSYSMGFSGLALRRGNQVQPLYELSTGYKAVLSMIMELAYRSVLLNPDAAIDDDSQMGIVIIDEIDAHLHPKWQWRIIDALKKCFPKIQFIIATHSPIVIASAKNARLIDMEERGQVFYSEGAYGYNVADVLELKQGSSAISKVLAGYMNRLEDALDKGDITESDRVIADAEDEFGKDSPVYAELRSYLEVNRWVEDN